MVRCEKSVCDAVWRFPSLEACTGFCCDLLPSACLLPYVTVTFSSARGCAGATRCRSKTCMRPMCPGRRPSPSGCPPRPRRTRRLTAARTAAASSTAAPRRPTAACTAPTPSAHTRVPALGILRWLGYVLIRASGPWEHHVRLVGGVLTPCWRVFNTLLGGLFMSLCNHMPIFSVVCPACLAGHAEQGRRADGLPESLCSSLRARRRAAHGFVRSALKCMPLKIACYGLSAECVWCSCTACGSVTSFSRQPLFCGHACVKPHLELTCLISLSASMRKLSQLVLALTLFSVSCTLSVLQLGAGTFSILFSSMVHISLVNIKWNR